MKTGAELIAEERERQIAQEGWTPEHDDGHKDESLARAACAYAYPTGGAVFRHAGLTVMLERQWFWPWPIEQFKGKHGLDAKLQTKEQRETGRIRDLVKAGALIAAEIDRLQRQTPPAAPARE
jgi:hypothetical protein